MRYKGNICVVEIKGVTGSATEKHATQLEKWVSIYSHDHDLQPKGILVVNPFRDKPLIERTEPSFPHQMLGYSTKRDHCLITSLQLLLITIEAKNHPERSDDLVQSILKTVGIYTGFTDWSLYIKRIEALDSSTE